MQVMGGAGYCREFPVERLKITVMHPRGSHPDVPIRSEEVDIC
jgi:hypothetical protein